MVRGRTHEGETLGLKTDEAEGVACSAWAEQVLQTAQLLSPTDQSARTRC